MASLCSSFGETRTRLCGVPLQELQSSAFKLEHYPQISINCEMFNSTPGSFLNRSVDSWRNVLVPVNEGVLKRITRTFFESGFVEALNEARSPATSDACPLMASSAEFMYKMLDYVAKLKQRIFPHMRELSITSIANYSETRDWIRSYIRCIIWHPNCFKIAVAGCDDVIRIYTDEPAVVPVLKSHNQKWISSMAWRPFTAAELAVGCQGGVCLWTMDSNLHITRSCSQSIFLKHPNHCPITAVQWNCDGTLLATSSINNSDVIIWDVDKVQNSILKRVGPPCSLLKWSPDGSNLFSATISNVFRVWSTDKCWVPERWTIATGTIQSACWSPCSSFLLFVTSDDPILYRLNFFEEQIFATGPVPKQAVPIADLSKCNNGQREIGGQPQALTWDPNGLYLAVTFKDSSCIAIFSTCIQKFNLTISPSGFITGICSEYPSYICFQSKNRKNTDSILTIGWSSGRVQYFPFVNI